MRHEVKMDDALEWLEPGGRVLARVASEEEDTHASEDPDRALVAEAWRDPSRFLALYDRHFARVHGYVRLRISDPASAEDDTSDVFITALTKLGDFRGEGSFSAWLFRIAQNAVRAAHRRQPAASWTEEALPIRDDSPGPEEQVLIHERLAELRGLFGALRQEHQDLLALRYVAGLSYKEIGQVVDTSTVAARVAVHRILEDLRRRYSHD
jgi:RNA polymerase sigma-70 factor (ECF subfamily)